LVERLRHERVRLERIRDERTGQFIGRRRVVVDRHHLVGDHAVPETAGMHLRKLPRPLVRVDHLRSQMHGRCHGIRRLQPIERLHETHGRH